MDYFFVILPKVMSFLILILIGIIAVKVKIATRENLSLLSGLLLKIVLPLLTIKLLYEQNVTFSDMFSFGGMLLGQLLLYLFLAVLGIICSLLMKMEYPRSNTHRGCMVCDNFGFVVIPLINALFAGTYGTRYIPICFTFDAFIIWTLGLTLFTWTREGGGSTSLKNICNPVLGSVLVGLAITSFSIPIPETVMSVISQVGDTSSSLGLIYMGCSLCFIEKVSAKNLRQIFVLALTKMLIAPVIVYAVAIRFLPQTESIILMLTAGAPTMTTSVMLTKQYGLDSDYAAEAVSVTTLACVATIPLLFLLVSGIPVPA